MMKNRVRSNCDCESGCTKCKSTINRYLDYNSSGIPLDYWPLSMKDFQGDQNFKKFIINYLENIDQNYEDGSSLGFVGNFGTGKTYAACSILKYAISKGYTAKFINMSDIINELTSSYNRDFMDNITDVDFLVIDEFDLRFIFPSEKSEQLFGQTLELILRKRFQDHMPVILCSNTEDIDTVLSKDFSRAFSSLRNKFMKVLYVSGVDFRKKV